MSVADLLRYVSYPRAVMFLPGCAVSTGFVREREIGSAGNWPPVPGGTGLQVLLAAWASGMRQSTDVVTAYQGIVVWITVSESQDEQISV